MDICDPLLSPKTKLNNAKGTLISTRNQQIYLFCDVVWSLTPISYNALMYFHMVVPQAWSTVYNLVMFYRK